VIFKACDTGETFNFTPDENKNIDVFKLVEDFVKKSTKFGDLIPPVREVKLKMIGECLKKLILSLVRKGKGKLMM